MYMLRTVCPNQLAEAVCQRCFYEKVICKAHAKIYRRKPMTQLHAVAEPSVRASIWDCF